MIGRDSCAPLHYASKKDRSMKTTAIARLAAVTLASFLGLATPASAWTPPIGVPAPQFGINQVAPPTPNPWLASTPGFYYVDKSHPAATDSGNAYGSPATPRRTIPLTLPAGALVELHGAYDEPHNSPRGITMAG